MFWKDDRCWGSYLDIPAVETAGYKMIDVFTAQNVQRSNK